MEDLAGLDFHASMNSQKPISSATTSNYFPTLRPTPPLSGRSTPTLIPPSKVPVVGKLPGSTSTSGNDSFANLLPFSASIIKPVSLQERQNKRQEEQAQQQQDRWRVAGKSSAGDQNGRYTRGENTSRGYTSGENTGGATSHGGTTNGWNKPESMISTPGRPPVYTATSEYGALKLSSAINKPFPQIPQYFGPLEPAKPANASNDLLRAFESPDRSSSHLPLPKQHSSISYTGTSSTNIAFDHLDDDPFGLGIAPAISNSKSLDADDDVLGLLGIPISELPQRTLSNSSTLRMENTVHLQDGPLAELVDMGFDPEKAAEALQATENGTDLQAAVSSLLIQAHQEAKHQSSSRSRLRDPPEESGINQATGNPADWTALPAWIRQQGRSKSPKDGTKQSVPSEKDAMKMATELGTNLFKSANSLWKTGTKKLNQAVTEMNSDSDSSQPKWMQQAKGSSRTNSQPNTEPDLDLPTKRPSSHKASADTMTEEAMMLESGGQRPRQRPESSNLPAASSLNSSRDHSPIQSLDLPQRERVHPRPTMLQARSKLSRNAIEEDMATAYVSPARRKGIKPAADSSNFIGTSQEASTIGSAHQSHHQSRNSSRLIPRVSSPMTSRLLPSQRHIPHLSNIALQACITHRHAGTAAFKIGNYASATEAYTAGLASLPSSHPLASVLLTNRALTYLKNGDPKASLADATSALQIIGPARGESESIDLGPTEPQKSMHAVWGKAMTRHAEALEQLEKWTDATEAWRTCVEAGINSSTSIQGRDRCGKMAGNQAQKTTLEKQRLPTKSLAKLGNRPALLSASTTTSAAASAAATLAVARLRAANEATERADDERFALADSVDARLTAWRSGREGNLRALLGGLGTILGPESGWRAIGMSELVMAARVKMAYMKGIARVHPDKLPPTATTEQIMISGAVFSTLNEAWDRFKAENGL